MYSHCIAAVVWPRMSFQHLEGGRQFYTASFCIWAISWIPHNDDQSGMFWVVSCQELFWTPVSSDIFRDHSKERVGYTKQMCLTIHLVAEPLHSQMPHQKEASESILVSERKKSCSAISCTIVLNVTCSALLPQQDSILPHPSPPNDFINVR